MNKTIHRKNILARSRDLEAALKSMGKRWIGLGIDAQQAAAIVCDLRTKLIEARMSAPHHSVKAAPQTAPTPTN